MQSKGMIWGMIALAMFINVVMSNTCQFENFQLGQLNLPDNNNWFYNATAPTGEVYYWNICGQVSSTYCSHAQGTSVCQLSSNRHYSAGFESSQLLSENNQRNGVFANYTGGDVCTSVNGAPARSAVINIVCSDDVDAVTSFIRENDCIYYLQMLSVYGCSGASSLVYSLFLLSILFFAL